MSKRTKFENHINSLGWTFPTEYTFVDPFTKVYICCPNGHMNSVLPIKFIDLICPRCIALKVPTFKPREKKYGKIRSLKQLAKGRV